MADWTRGPLASGAKEHSRANLERWGLFTMLTRIAIALAPWLIVSRMLAAPQGDQGHDILPAESLKSGLMSALGDEFEFVDGEVGRTQTRVGARIAERFWFARVRAKAAGEFALAYSIRFEQPQKTWMYVIPFKVGQRGTSRLIQPHSELAPAWPTANIGDTLIIPIDVDVRRGHEFKKHDAKGRDVTGFFSIAGENRHEDLLKRAAVKAVVENKAADQLDLLASWRSSMVNQTLTQHLNTLTGYVKFKHPGEYNLGEQLFQVLPQDKPVVVLLQHFRYTEFEENFSYRSSSIMSPGTFQVRVGDRALINCEQYMTSTGAESNEHRLGKVVALQFTPAQPYEAEPPK